MADPEKPRVVGRYALYDRLAAGGMASVHIGRFLGPVGFARTVAVKQLHPELATDPEIAAMFVDEARLVARIHHPHVVPTLDVVSADGELLIVMEYIRGESLSGLLRAAAKQRSRVPPAMAATILAGALHGLHAAHEAKSERGEPLHIVHRDVSPQNILVGVDGVPRVLDFGVAKAAGRAHSTRDGQLKGKLPYMAPEQVRGQVTRATDVYAAAVVLWEILARRSLFTGAHEGQILANVLAGCTEPPSAHQSDVPPALDEIVLRGLRLDPSERFATARDFARALEEAIGLLPPLVVGEWVESLVGPVLARRAERIAEIEADTLAPAPQDTPPSRGATAILGVHRSETPPSVAEVPTQLSSSAGPRARSEGDRGSKSRTALLVLAGVGLVGFGGVAASWLRPSDRPAAIGIQDSALPVAPSRSEPVVPAPSVTASPPPVTVTPAATQAPSASAAPTEKPSSAPVRSTPAAPRGSGAPRPAAAAPAHDCNPPYYFDGRGLKVFKKECL